MTIKVRYLSEDEIEQDAELLLAEYKETAGASIKLPVPVAGPPFQGKRVLESLFILDLFGANDNVQCSALTRPDQILLDIELH